MHMHTNGMCCCDARKWDVLMPMHISKMCADEHAGEAYMVKNFGDDFLNKSWGKSALNQILQNSTFIPKGYTSLSTAYSYTHCNYANHTLCTHFMHTFLFGCTHSVWMHTLSCKIQGRL